MLQKLSMTPRKLLALVMLLLLGNARGDYSCLCSYEIETPVYSNDNKQSAPLGYMYEFDCKAIYQEDGASASFQPVQYEKKIGYVLMNSADIFIQTCAGDIPKEDLVTKPSTSHSVTTPVSIPSTVTSSTTSRTSSSTLLASLLSTTATSITTSTGSPVASSKITSASTTTIAATTQTAGATFPSSTIERATSTIASTSPTQAASTTIYSTKATTSLATSTKVASTATTEAATSLAATTKVASTATTKAATTQATTTKFASTATTKATTTLAATTQVESTSTTHVPSTTNPSTTAAAPSSTITSTTTTRSQTTLNTSTVLTTQQPHCNNGWLLHQDSCYYIYTHDRRTWGDANSYCLSRGAHLLIVQSQSENSFIIGKLKDRINTDNGTNVMTATWIGGTNRNNEGMWVWKDSHINTDIPINGGFTFWHPGQPNADDGDDDCLCMVGNDGFEWRDYLCSKHMFFVCERPAVPTTSSAAATLETSSITPSITSPSTAIHAHSTSKPATTIQAATTTVGSTSTTHVPSTATSPTTASTPIPTASTTTTMSPTTLQTISSLTTQKPHCSAGWLLHQESCYFIDTIERRTWDDANTYCLSRGAHLLIVQSQSENLFIIGQLRGRINTDSGTNLMTATWIGGTNRNYEGEWLWRDSNTDIPIDGFTFWHPGQPDADDGDDDCLSMVGNDGFEWRDYLCSKHMFFVCERPAIQTISSAAATLQTSIPTSITSPSTAIHTFAISSSKPDCNAGWFLHQESCYYIDTNERRTWDDANSYCHSRGAHLLTVQSQSENSFIIKQLSHKIDIDNDNDLMTATWIGGTDNDDEGTWVWRDSHAHTDTPIDGGFAFWHPGQPDADGGEDDEDCICMVGNDGFEWQDYICDEELFFMCERSAVATISSVRATTPPFAIHAIANSTPKPDCHGHWLPYQDSCYFIFSEDRMDWNDANNYCTRHHAHLATLQSQGENSFIISKLRHRIPTDTNRNARSGVWVGATDHDDEGTWVWRDSIMRTDTPVSSGFTFWNPGQPNSGNGDHQEDCMSLTGNKGFKWEDHRCSLEMFFVCERSGYNHPSIPIIG